MPPPNTIHAAEAVAKHDEMLSGSGSIAECIFCLLTGEWAQGMSALGRNSRRILAGSSSWSLGGSGAEMRVPEAQNAKELLRYQRRSGASRAVATSPHGWTVIATGSVSPIKLRTFS